MSFYPPPLLVSTLAILPRHISLPVLVRGHVDGPLRPERAAPGAALRIDIKPSSGTLVGVDDGESLHTARARVCQRPGMSLEFVHISKRNNAASMLYSARNHAVQHRCSEAVVETRKMQQWWCGCETHPPSNTTPSVFVVPSKWCSASNTSWVNWPLSACPSRQSLHLQPTGCMQEVVGRSRRERHMRAVCVQEVRCGERGGTNKPTYGECPRTSCREADMSERRSKQERRSKGQPDAS